MELELHQVCSRSERVTMSDSQKNPDEDIVAETKAALRAAIVKAVEVELEQEEGPELGIDVHIKSGGHGKGTFSKAMGDA
ncbi:hypothetical protein [Streptomyces sp. R33]|uniref:Uncharacterized protein n=1 Tax=Streptomyces sp. R33 TaxID=3238629 RepID=A0AB39YIT0_9ACTN